MDMASVNRSVALLVVMAEVVLLHLCQAAEYKVGDSAGWTNIGNVDYKQWAATKTFKVGDIIRNVPGDFASFGIRVAPKIDVFSCLNPSLHVNIWPYHFEYNPQFQNVLRVTHAMYRACNASAPLATYTTGNDYINITTKGHHLFICGVPGHCQAGQRVDINVPRTPVAPTPAPSPSEPSPSPAPAPSSASSLQAPAGIDHPKLGLAMAAFVAFALGFA